MTNHTFVGIGEPALVPVDQGLQFGHLIGLVNLDEGLPGVVCAAGTRQEIVVDVGLLAQVQASWQEERRALRMAPAQGVHKRWWAEQVLGRMARGRKHRVWRKS